MPFKPVTKRYFTKILLIASTLIPLYVIYMSIFGAPLQVSIFTSIYSTFILILWVLLYLGIFDKKPKIHKVNGSLKIENDDVISHN